MAIWPPGIEDVTIVGLGWSCTSPFETCATCGPSGFAANAQRVGSGQEDLCTGSSCLPVVGWEALQSYSCLGYLTIELLQ